MARPYHFLRAIAFWLGSLAPLAIQASPALWVARHGPSTIYLLGTVHLLPSDSDWSSPALDKALRASQELIIEVANDDAGTLQPLVQQLGVDPRQTLSAQLNRADQARLQAAVEAAKLPGGEASLESMRPWLAALRLTLAPLTQAGFDPDQGVDKILRSRMQAAGKPVQGLETAEQQLRLLADLPQAEQLDMLRQSFDEVSDGPQRVRQLVDAWKQGDVAAIARFEDEDLRAQSPSLYQALIVRRNRAWARTIGERMRSPGIRFVAVGAGHLAGPDSLQVQLRREGFSVERQ